MSTTTITSIQRGIIFLMAEWSGPAQLACRQLIDFLQQRGIPSEQLHVLNVDHHPELYNMPELVGKIHGWGETAIVKDGRIVFVIDLGKNPHQFQKQCNELLQAYSI